MHTIRTHHLAGTLAGLVLLLGLGASATLAKEGIEVSLAAPISRDAQPGDVVPVFFRLDAISDSGTAPLRGSDVFLRLFGPTGASTKAAGAEGSKAGLYKAMIEIPAGGATRAEFGIHGTAKDASGRTVASDVVWPYDGILVAAAIPPARVDVPTAARPVEPVAEPAADPATTSAATAPSTSPPVTVIDLRLALGAALAGGLAVALAVALALAVGRRRRMHDSPA